MKRKIRKQLMIAISAVVLIVSIVFYTKYTTKAELDEVTVYLAANDIAPRTEIKEGDLMPVNLPSRSVPPNAIVKKNDIVGKYTTQGFGIPTNSYFYEDKLVEKDNLPDAALLKLKEGEAAIPLTVDLESSLANSIIPETYIDLYFTTKVQTEKEQKVISGAFLENVRVISVKDSSADNVFDDEAEKNSKRNNNALTKIYIFAVPEEYVSLVNNAKKIGEVSPIATSRTYELNNEVKLTSEEVVKFINASVLKLDEANEVEGIITGE